MSRMVPAVIAGLLLGQVVAGLFWWWGFYAYPPSPLYDMNPALARAQPGGLPFLALAFQALGQALGVFLGGLWALRLAREGAVPAWAVGAVSFVIAVLWMLFHPRPLWFPILAAICMAMGAWLAVRISGADARA